MTPKGDDVSSRRVDTPRLAVEVVTGGHPFEQEPFFDIFSSIPEIAWSRASSPSVGSDVVVFYDMPGLRFTKGDPPVELVAPTSEQQDVFAEFAERGTGLVFIHHSAASWPTWEAFADIVGARFHYQPARLHGVDYPDSGFVFDVEHTVDVIRPDHPVCAGIGESFTLTDELYCFPVHESEVVPLMRTRFPTDDPSHFFSADLAIRGRMNSRDGWSHPAGSNLVAWVKSHGNAPVVYLQFGDGPVTYANKTFRAIVRNAINWAGSDDARSWARDN